MVVKEKYVGDVVVVMPKGKIMGGPETDACHHKVKSMIAEGHKKLVVDLSKVKWVNSLGLGMLIACYTSCKNAGGGLKIAGASENVNHLLMITKLVTVFDCFDNADQAIGSLR